MSASFFRKSALEKLSTPEKLDQLIKVTGTKAWIALITIIVIIFTLLTFLFIQLGFAWWGASPFHPDFQEGYWLSQLLFLFWFHLCLIGEKNVFNNISFIPTPSTNKKSAFNVTAAAPGW